MSQTALATPPAAEDAKARMEGILARQKAAHIREGAPSKAKRIDRINRCIALLVDHESELVEALNADFGARSKDASRLTDIAGSIGPLKFARDNLGAWMKPDRRKVEAPLGLFGAKAEVRYQPKGTVGVISPWNFPVNLTFAPLAGILAAGNRSMVKPSELTPATSDAMLRLFDLYFDEEEIAVITGGPEVGAAFSGLAFDHLVFTGGTSIAYHVMKAASANLVPLTLELGGKSPVIVGPSADLEKSAARIMNGKTLNAGQICLAPDYVLAPADRLPDFVAAAKTSVGQMFPSIRESPDYTAIVTDRHYARLMDYLDDARAKGAEIVEINPSAEDLRQQPHRRIAPTLILNPTDEMKVMQEEIFGPLLPVKAYRDVQEAIDYINGHDRPLGLYYFGSDTAERDRVLDATTSGGVTVNDVVMHVAQEELPFGGIGPAGMGSYHGHDGFREFSHRKSIYHQIKWDLAPLRMLRPPYGTGLKKYLGIQIKR